MKRTILLLIIAVYVFVNCTSKTWRFVIVNKSDEEVVAFHNRTSFLKDSMDLVHPDKWSRRDYSDFLRRSIPPNSSKRMEYWEDFLQEWPNDTLFIGLFNRVDLDTMTLFEFKTKYPIKHEFKVILQDMINCDWTLVYPPDEL